MFHILLILLTVTVATQVCARLCRWLRQPAVIGEIFGGILLGPSLFGQLAPDLQAFIFPKETLPFVGYFAQVGVVLYMFVVGLELDFKKFKYGGRAVLPISYASMLLPFGIGVALAYLMSDKLIAPGISMIHFSAFLGISLSITAFPVLARILDDTELRKTSLGTLALAIAAVGDATAWCLLAALVSVVHSQTSQVLTPIAMTIGFMLVMWFGVRPLMRHVLKWVLDLDAVFVLVLVGALACAVITEWIGIHAIFGAFAFGAILPSESQIAEPIADRLHALLKVLFLPVFFAFTGLRTQMGLVSGWEDWAICALIIVVASLGKFGGAFLMSRAFGFTLRESAALGSLLNARGLVELIVLNVGLDLGIISPRVFAMLVVMALVTTLMSTPATLSLLPKGIRT